MIGWDGKECTVHWGENRLIEALPMTLEHDDGEICDRCNDGRSGCVDEQADGWGDHISMIVRLSREKSF